MQCLFASPHFRSFILSYNKTSTSSPDLIQGLIQLFKDLSDQQSPLKFVMPKHLLKSIHVSMGKLIDVHEQNDITEFLSIFIDKLNHSISYKIDPLPPPINSSELRKQVSPYKYLQTKLERAWLMSHAREMSELSNIVYGQVINQINCGHCDKKHHNYEVFTSIPLAMKPSKNNNLVDLIAHHFDDHSINVPGDDNSGDKWKCDKCKETVQSIASSCVWRLPQLLIFSLKRFDEKMNKNAAHISLPETIDMEKWTLKRDEPTVYRLIGVAVHIGSFFGGHYYAIVKHDDRWFKIDDEMAMEITNDKDLAYSICNGYQYFYERS